MGLSIDERYTASHPKSKELWERSLRVSRGTHHDSRYAQPFQIYTSHSLGSRKWDVDGNEYIDYSMGHGSLMLGHAHPELVEATTQQVARGTHYGTEQPLSLEWAEWVTRLVPAAEKVEFTMSGTEADMMIAQLARAFTGRKKILKFAEHFFGWSDSLLVGTVPPYDKPMAGRLPAVTEDAVSDATVVIPLNDQDAMERELAKGDFAALFIEGGGAHAGDTGLPPELVRSARELTKQYGTLLVIDEVISGFRWSPGGYQATVGVTPDLSALGKMVSGGLPGAAVCGKAEVMELLAIKAGEAERNRHRRIYHPGTWNANPLSAAAGIAMLRMVADGEAQKRAEQSARAIAMGVNGKIEERGIEARMHNASSVIHMFVGKAQKWDGGLCLDLDRKAQPGAILALDKYLLQHGVHLLRGAIGFVSAIHSEQDVDQTIDVFGRAFDEMIEDGILTPRP
jgi:glutamate-1-semialdehyde 2,1-aminomutase